MKEIKHIPKNISNVDYFMHEHPVGINICYWILVQLDAKDLESIKKVMEEYAKYYHKTQTTTTTTTDASGLWVELLNKHK